MIVGGLPLCCLPDGLGTHPRQSINLLFLIPFFQPLLFDHLNDLLILMLVPLHKALLSNQSRPTQIVAQILPRLVAMRRRRQQFILVPSVAIHQQQLSTSRSFRGRILGRTVSALHGPRSRNTSYQRFRPPISIVAGLF